MVINTNSSALTATTLLGQSATRLNQSLQRLSSGSKIVSPADDSAGLAVSMRMGAQIARIQATQNNIANAISFSQTQDLYLSKLSDALTRMSELAVRIMDPTLATTDRQDVDLEYQNLGAFISATKDMTFNGVSLFNGQSLNVTIDPEANTFAKAGVDGGAILNFNQSDDLLGNPNGTLNLVKNALNLTAQARAAVGSSLQRLQFHYDEMQAQSQNLSAANSRITDVDVAQESTLYAKYNILTQAGTAMLAQANSLPQSVLKLLG